MRIRATIVAGSLAVASLLPFAPAASAHVGRDLGDLHLEVGFANEPAYVGQPNAALIQLVHDGKPVTDLKDMTVTVTFGEQTSEPMDLEPAWFVEDGELESGVLGEYRAYFVPSEPGAYTFRFVGVADGEDVDEEFTSGPKTFDEVQGVATATFPEVNAPLNGELATRIDQESARTAAAVKAADADAASADDAASSATTLGIIGIVVAALGLMVAIGALVSARKARG